MSDQILVADMEDWSLQAIVRGSSGDYANKIADTEMDGHDSFFDTHHHYEQFDREFLSAGFPEIFAGGGSTEELQELYKPFYNNPVIITRSSPVQTSGTVLDFQQEQKLHQNVLQDHDDKPQSRCDQEQKLQSTCVARVSPGYTPKYKKRKNQHKRVVVQVSAEGLASDMWAWRKYGQKPIKGSPHPRSYYRCSSSKGCLARKQVEESCTDPGKFIITYTAEHSHSQPTRRNSLAGTVRQKFPSPSSKSPNKCRAAAKQGIAEVAVAVAAHQSSSSPKTLIDHDEVLDTAAVPHHHQARIKEESKVENEVLDDDHDDGDSMVSDFVFNEEFFSGLEDLDQFMMADLPGCHSSAHQFPVRSCSWF